MSTTSNYRTRVLQEEVDLNEKIIKLEKFIKSAEFDKLNYMEQQTLKIQFKAMDMYHDCLVHRIESFAEQALEEWDKENPV